MRMTVNLDEDLYLIAKGLSKEQDITISKAVNHLLRRSLEPVPSTAVDSLELPIVKGRKPITSEDVYQAEEEHLEIK